MNVDYGTKSLRQALSASTLCAQHQRDVHHGGHLRVWV